MKKPATLAVQNAPDEDSDQTAQMRRLIGVFSECTCPEGMFSDVVTHMSTINSGALIILLHIDHGFVCGYNF